MERPFSARHLPRLRSKFKPMAAKFADLLSSKVGPKLDESNIDTRVSNGERVAILWRDSVQNSWQKCVLYRVSHAKFEAYDENGERSLAIMPHGLTDSGAPVDDGVVAELGMTLEGEPSQSVCSTSPRLLLWAWCCIADPSLLVENGTAVDATMTIDEARPGVLLRDASSLVDPAATNGATESVPYPCLMLLVPTHPADEASITDVLNDTAVETTGENSARPPPADVVHQARSGNDVQANSDKDEKDAEEQLDSTAAAMSDGAADEHCAEDAERADAEPSAETLLTDSGEPAAVAEVEKVRAPASSFIGGDVCVFNNHKCCIWVVRPASIAVVFNDHDAP
eukprot:6183481-Pleurochrysis_carterae.AAC.7